MAEEVIREIETASIDTILDASFVHVFIFRPPLHMWRLIMVLFVYESALSNIPNKLFHRKNDNENQILTQDSHFLPKTVPKT